MIHNRLLLGIFLLLALFAGQSTGICVEPAREAGAPEVGAVDLIPADVAGGIAIRNVAELTKRGDALIDKAELKVTSRLSDLYRFAVTFLGVHRGLDNEGAAMLVALKTQFDEGTFVMAVPVADVTAMAGNFKLTERELAAGNIIDRHEREGKDVVGFVRHVSLRGRHLYMGGTTKSVESAMKAKPLGEVLGESDRAALAADDIVCYVNRKRAGAIWTDLIAGLNNELKMLDASKSEALGKIVDAANELEFAIAGVRLDEGVGSTLLLQFAGDKSRGILSQFGGVKARASLAGLPHGQVLAAHTSSGDGDASASLVRLLLLTKLPIDEQMFISAAHRANVVGVFGEIWQRLEGSRSALYENEDPDRNGHFSLVAILETDDAERFVTDVTSLSHFVNAAMLSPDEVGAAVDAKSISDLVKQLGHDDFRTRQLASTKLELIGTPALTAIEKAVRSNDPEVQFRAQTLCDLINARVAEQRMELLDHDLLTRIKPNFAYFPKQETRSGRPVDIVQIKLRSEEAQYAPQLRRFLGPEWSKLRMATVGKRVVVLLGSNTALLDKAIANIKSNEPGLQTDGRYAGFRSRATAEQTAEFHVRLSRSLELAVAGAAGKPNDGAAAEATSLGIAITPQRLRLDLFAPTDEVKRVMAQYKW